MMMFRIWMCVALTTMLVSCGKDGAPTSPTPAACGAAAITIGLFSNGAPPSPGQGMVWTSYFGSALLPAQASVYVVDLNFAPAGCVAAWTAVSADTSAVQLSPASGSAQRQVELFIPGNPGAQRSTLVTIAGQTATITQSGATATSPGLPVRGTVVDFQTARPLAGAVVGFASSSSGSVTGATAVTDANGQYSLPEPPGPNRYYFMIDNRSVGQGYPHGANRRAGDVAVDNGRCVTRYGMVMDSKTYLPIVGAQILNLSNVVIATTDRDGWYQFDFGCGVGSIGFNTTWVIATHPDYTPQNFSGGRGWSGVSRDDVLLTRK